MSVQHGPDVAYVKFSVFNLKLTATQIETDSALN